jgi:hypothetical protein
VVAGTIAVSGIYDRFDRLPEVRTALTVWSDYFEALVSGEEKKGRSSTLAASPRPPPDRLSVSATPSQLAFASGDPEIARARSRVDAPSASSDRISRSRETDGSPPSILATRDWLEWIIRASSV